MYAPMYSLLSTLHVYSYKQTMHADVYTSVHSCPAKCPHVIIPQYLGPPPLNVF